MNWALVSAVLALAGLPAAADAQTGTTGALEVELRSGATTSTRTKLYNSSQALVIGIDAYAELGWPALTHANSDAKAVAEALKVQGFDVTLLRDPGSVDLDGAVKAFFAHAGQDPTARLVFWFGGHGHTIDGRGYIVPADAAAPQAEQIFLRKAIPLQRLASYMRQAKARHVLAVFDSCFSTDVFNADRNAAPAPMTPVLAEPVLQFISACESAEEVAGDGRFRQLFVDALATKPSPADANGDGYVTGTELGRHLQSETARQPDNRQTLRHGKSMASGFDRGDIVFQAGKTVMTPEQATAAIVAIQPKGAAGPGTNPADIAQPGNAQEQLNSLKELAGTLRSSKRYGEAIVAYSKAIAMLPRPVSEHWTIFYGRGTSYERMKNWPAAEADLLKALSLSPNQPIILNYLGYSWIEKNMNMPRALAMIEKAVSLKPDDGYIVDSLGWAHFQMGNFKEAVKHLQRAIELNSDDPTLNDHLGDALWRTGKTVEAVEYWRKAVSLPEVENADAIRKKIAGGMSPLIKPRQEPRTQPKSN